MGARTFAVKAVWIALSKSPLVRWVFPLLSALSFYDLFVSQFIPDSISKSFPKAWQVAMTTGNLLSWWGWTIILMSVLVVGLIEYIYRTRHSISAPPLRVTNPSEIAQLPSSSEERFTPLSEAAQRAYTALKDAEVGRTARMQGDANRAAILNTMATHIWQEVPIYGKRPVSLEREEIPTKFRSSLWFMNGATSLHQVGKSDPSYIELELKESDESLAIQRLTPGNQLKRIPITAFLCEMDEHYSLLSDDDLLRALVQSLRQAGSDGAINFWGRVVRFAAHELARQEPLLQIPNEHWTDFQINILDAFDLSDRGALLRISSDNFRVGTYTLIIAKQRDTRYLDLHIDGESAAKWFAANPLRDK